MFLQCIPAPNSEPNSDLDAVIPAFILPAITEWHLSF